VSEIAVITEAGLARLRRQLDRLEQRLLTLRRQKGEVAEVGGDDWHDNAAFEHLEREERMLIRQITELRRRLDSTLVVTDRSETGEVGIGSTVRVRFDDGAIMTLTIGGDGEGDPGEGIVAYNSPVGRALLGARRGERRPYQAGGAAHWLEVTEVRKGTPDGDE